MLVRTRRSCSNALECLDLWLQGGLDLQEGEPNIVVARHDLPVDLLRDLEDQKQPGGRPQDLSSSRDLQDPPSEFAYTITTGAGSGSRVQSPRLPLKVLGREASQQQQPSVAPGAGREVAAAAGDARQLQPAGAMAGAGSAAAVLAAAGRLSQQVCDRIVSTSEVVAMAASASHIVVAALLASLLGVRVTPLGSSA